jgi:hypothetical protein
VTRPVVYGALVQGVTLTVYQWVAGHIGPEVFLVGMVGPIVAAVFSEIDAEVVAAPTAGVLGTFLFFGGYLAYGLVVASQFPYVRATWVFAQFVAMTIAWSFLLLGGFFLFGMIVGWLVWYGKTYLKRKRRTAAGGN